jgi:predicted cupin superfamily sugar epimerase
VTFPEGPDVSSPSSGGPGGRVGELIAALELVPHPERGYYVETYRASLVLSGAALPQGAPRAASTAIYFLVTAAEPTTFLHRLRSDEIFHLYEGGPLDILLCGENEAVVRRLGRDVAAGERPQLVIPAGTWFGTELAAGASHALVGCTVAPGFDFADFELEAPVDLATRFPSEATRVRRMTRPLTLTRA